ncbi:hypothetical protein ACN08P_09010 [Photobacterium leiognathi subsp. mandapamensis]|uniref:hypothetical protein n=1 Tax=Photobacterium leiognathi TaxID=553611 RepID=UPI003AF39895
MKNFILLLFISFSSITFANTWSGSVVGSIANIDVAPGENYGFRVSLIGQPPLCGNQHTWAYLQESDSNYHTFVSVILAAKMSDKKIQLYTRKKDNADSGYCHIGYIVLL